jgi:hypothetical protein
MVKHLGYTLMGALLFFVATLVTLKFTESGVQHDGLFKGLSDSEVLKSILKASVWIGALAGGITSIALRKSENRKTYVWIVLIFILIFTEFVISTIY